MAKKKQSSSNQTVHPNDRFFRSYLGKRRVARQLLRWQLPESLQKAINWSTVRVRGSTFVDEKLRLRESDLLIECRTKGDQPLLVYVLWEHQSKVEPMMAWRLLEYRVEIMKHWVAENPKAKALPYVHSLVLYQGKSKWSAAMDIEGIIDHPTGAATLQAIRSEYEVLPVVDLPNLGWPTDLSLKIALGLMRAVTLKQQCQWLIEQSDEMKQLLNEPDGEGSFRVVVEYILVTENDERKVIEAIQQCSKPVEAKAMSVADQLIARGLKEGLEQGIEQQNRRIVETMLQKGVAVDQIAEMTGIETGEVKKIAKQFKES